MIGYATIINEIRDFLERDGLAKTITHADIFDRDNNNKNVYPLVNIVPVGITFDDNVSNFQIDVECLDIRDLRDDINRDNFKLNSNLIDNLNTCYAILTRLFDHLTRHENIVVELLTTGTPFIYSDVNTLDGWVFNFNIIYEETEQSVC